MRGDPGIVDRRARRLVARLLRGEQRHDDGDAATGKLRKKIDCQETFSTRKPPTGPIASASAETPAQVPIALPRSAGGKALVMIESVAGHHERGADALDRAPATSHASLCEKPMALDSAKTTTPKRNMLAAAEDVTQATAGDEQHGEGSV